MKYRLKWLITAALAALLLTGLIVLNVFIARQGDLLLSSEASTNQQNYSVISTENDSLLIIGTNQNTVQAFQDRSDLLWTFETNGSVRSLEMHEPSQRVFVGSEDRNVYVLSLEDGSLLNKIEVQRRIYSIDLNHDATEVLVSAGVSTLNHNILIYDLETNEQKLNISTGITCKKARYTSDDQHIIVANDRGELIKYNLNGEKIKIAGLRSEITDMVINHKHGFILTNSRSNIVNILDEDINKIKEWEYYGEGRSIAVTDDMNYIAIGNYEGFVYLLNQDGQIEFENRLAYTVTGLYFTPEILHITGLDNFIYELNVVMLERMELVNQFNRAVPYFYTFIILFFILALIRGVVNINQAVLRFFKIVYRYRTAYLMLLPTFGLLAIFRYYPVFIAFTRSFTDWSIHTRSINELNFIGVDNYVKMVREGYFLIGLQNLGILLITSVIKIITVPLIVAEIVFLMRKPRQKYWFRFAFVLPMVVPGIVMALMWQQIYDPTIGLMNNLLRVATGNSDLLISWLGNPRIAIWSIVLMGFPWINPFAFLVYYGGLINIPQDLFEAAAVDGSSGFWNFTRIHLPLLSSQFKLLLILNFITVIQDYQSIFILTGGGPDTATYVPGLELYYNATRFNQYGYACALGVVMFIFILGGTILNMRMRTQNAE